ncbi:MAG: hypothetical protein DRN07_04050, partial [Thermoplasmata archaeon]
AAPHPRDHPLPPLAGPDLSVAEEQQGGSFAEGLPTEAEEGLGQETFAQREGDRRSTGVCPPYHDKETAR